MILECTACGKMFKVKDKAASVPRNCTKCGGELRTTGAAPDKGSREQELEARVKELEKKLEDAQASSSGDADDRLETLRGEILEAEQKVREADRKNSDLRAQLDAEKAERARLESEVKGSEKTQSKAVQEKQKTIKRLEDSIADYRSKIDSLQGRLDKVEMQRLADVNSFDNRVREKSQSEQEALAKLQEEHKEALAQQRSELEKQISEKDLQISDNRQALDREASERRRLNEVLSRLQETADRTLKEKDKALQAAEKSAGKLKAKIETLEKRAESLDRMRRSEADSYAQRLRSLEAVEPRVTEASHLATDFNTSLDEMAEVLSGLRDRVSRLKKTLVIPRTSAATTAGSFASSASPAEGAASKGAISQAASFGFAAAPPPSAPEPVEEEPEEIPEVVEQEPEEETPMKEEASPGVLEEVPDGIVEEPSSISLPELRAEEPAPEEELEEAEPEEEPEPAAAAEEEPSDLPLISPPEETPKKPIRAIEKEPEPKAEPRKRSRFSWKRK